MQNAQNTFYITLRNRLVALNPSRTIYLRGITRPGILVESNELVVAQPPSDVFVLRWIGLHNDPYLSDVMLQMECEIAYMTEGTAGNLGMDRGAMLTEMDAELMSLLQPNTAQKINYASTPAVPMVCPVSLQCRCLVKKSRGSNEHNRNRSNTTDAADCAQNSCLFRPGESGCGYSDDF
jgi:hypothetical protein